MEQKDMKETPIRLSTHRDATDIEFIEACKVYLKCLRADQEARLSRDELERLCLLAEEVYQFTQG